MTAAPKVTPDEIARYEAIIRECGTTSGPTRSKSPPKAPIVQSGRRVVFLDEPTEPPEVEDLWSRTWFAVYVRPWHEAMVRRAFLDAGYGAFLPVRRYWNATRFRIRRQLEVALLTRYVFVGVTSPWWRLSDDDWSAVRNTDGVLAIVGDGHGPFRAPTENLIELAGELVSGAYDETQQVFAKGETATIGSGPFMGFSGTLDETVHSDADPNRPVPLLVRIFGRESLVHIPLADVRPGE